MPVTLPTKVLLIEDDGPPLKYIEISWRATPEVNDEDDLRTFLSNGAALWVATTSDGRNLYRASDDEITLKQLIEHAHFTSLVNCMDTVGLHNLVIRSYSRDDRMIVDSDTSVIVLESDGLTDFHCPKCDNLPDVGESLEKDPEGIYNKLCPGCLKTIKKASKPAHTTNAQPSKTTPAKTTPAKTTPAKTTKTTKTAETTPTKTAKTTPKKPSAKAAPAKGASKSDKAKH